MVERCLVPVDAVEELIASDLAGAVQHEACKEQAPLAARQRVLDPAPVQPTTSRPQSWILVPLIAASAQSRNVGERFG